MHPGNRSVVLDRASKGEGRKRWRETMQDGFVFASDSSGNHGGCTAEEGQAMTSSLAPCFLAACGEWTGGKWGSRGDGLRGWGNDPGSGFRLLTSAQREALLGSLPAPNPTPKPGQRLLRKPRQLPPGKPRLAERDVQKPPTLQLPIRWILLPDRVRELLSLSLPRPNYSVSGCNAPCKRNTSGLQNEANCSLLPPSFCQKHSICLK